jgi:hypothetical protein
MNGMERLGEDVEKRMDGVGLGRDLAGGGGGEFPYSRCVGCG